MRHIFNKYTLLSFLLISAFFNDVQAQSISLEDIAARADSTISEVQSLTYWCDMERKFLTREKRINQRTIVHLKRAAKDTSLTHYNAIALNQAKQFVYDGENLLHLNLSDSTAYIMHPDSVRSTYHFEDIVQESAIGLSIHRHLYKTDFFKKRFASPKAKVQLLSEDTLINNERAYAVRLDYEDSEWVYDAHSIYYFRHGDCFPIGKENESYASGIGGPDYYKYIWSNIVLNPCLSEDLFDIDYNVIDSEKVELYKEEK